MSDINESVVDPKLNAFLGQDLPSSGTRIDTNTADEFETDAVNPITETTLRQILYYLSLGISKDEANKIVDLMNKVQGMTEQDAQVLLKGLKIQANMTIDSDLVDYFVKESVRITFNPKDKKRKRSAKKSKYIHDCFAEGLHDLLGHLGWWSGLLVFGFYASASWHMKSGENEETTRDTRQEIEKEN